jgi:hypothetical protein
VISLGNLKGLEKVTLCAILANYLVEKSEQLLIATIVDYKWLRELTSLKTHRKIPSKKFAR